MGEFCENCKFWEQIGADDTGLLGICQAITERIEVGRTILRESRGKAFLTLEGHADERPALVTSYAFGCRLLRYKDEEE